MPTQEPHRALVAISAAVLLASVVMVLAGAYRIGVTTDEPFHAQRYDNYRATGWYLADFQMDGARPATGTTDQFVYGPATTTLLHGIGPSGTSRADYRLRHLGVALISLLGVAAVAATARTVLGSWRWGLLAAAALGAMPLWTGLGMFNVKDTPVATGCTLVTLGLVALARRSPGPRRLRIAAPVATAAGVFLSVGTRPGIVAAVLAGVIAAVVLVSLGPRWTRWRVLELLVGLGTASAALAVLYPKVFLDPTWPYRAVTSSSQFGRVRVKRSFVPLHVLTDQPLLITALALCGAGVVLALLVLRRGRPPGTAEIGGLLVIVQAGALPGTTLVHHTALENDLRQLLHAAPAVAVLVAVAVAHLSRLRPALVGVVAGLAVVVPTVDQATLFPYNYLWTNPLDDARPPGPRDQRDYMAATLDEASRAVDGPGRIICNKHTDREGLYRTPPMRLDDEDCPALTPEFGARDADADLLSPTFWFVGMRFVQPESCDEEDRVTRRLHGREVVLSTLARCTREFPVLDPTGARVDGDDRDSLAAFSAGWTLPTDGRPNPWGRPGARAVGRSAALVFAVPPELEGRPLVLVLDTDGRPQRPIQARVGPAATFPTWDGARLRVPIPAGPSPVLVRFSGDLDLAVTGLALVPAM